MTASPNAPETAHAPANISAPVADGADMGVGCPESPSGGLSEEERLEAIAASRGRHPAGKGFGLLTRKDGDNG